MNLEDLNIDSPKENEKKNENAVQAVNVVQTVNADSLNSSFRPISQSASGVFPTYFVFVDLPKHIEFRTDDLPILNKGMEMDFDVNIRNPRDPKKVKRIEGNHIASRILLKYGGKRPGITQYVEWKVMK